MGRILGAVLAGYGLVAALVVATDLAASVASPAPRAGAAPSAGYMAFSLVSGLIYALGGGYLAAFLARERAKTATVALVMLGEMVGLLSSLMTWKQTPHFYTLGLLLGFPMAIVIGSRLRVRQRPRTA